MPFARIDGKKVHDYRLQCQPSPCIYCFEFGLFYAHKMQSILSHKPEIFYSDQSFFLEVKESNGRDLLRKFYPQIRGLSLVHNKPSDEKSTRFEGKVKKDELIELFLNYLHLPKSEIIEKLGLRLDTYSVFSKIAKEHFDGTIVEDKQPDEPRELKFIKNLRRKSNLLIDQCPIKLTHLKRKVDSVDADTGLDYKDILCVGDNDLASLAISELYDPKSITVVDIDSSLLTRIRKTAKVRKYPIQTFNLDLRNYPKIHRKFDLFFTDPPYTKQGMTAFMRFGTSHLKLGGEGFIAVPRTNFEKWTLFLFNDVQQFIYETGCTLTSWLPNIHVYENDEGIPSGLIGIRKMSNEKIPKTPVNEDFYTYLARKVGELHAD